MSSFLNGPTLTVDTYDPAGLFSGQLRLNVNLDYSYSVPAPTTPSPGNPGENGGIGGNSYGSWDPIVLDLDGNGVSAVPLSDTGKTLSFASTNRLTAWVGAGDGLLAIDLNGNGLIDSQDEASFRDPARPDLGEYAVLRSAFDRNGNGFLDRADRDWGRFRLVIDGVLRTLDDVGIRSIDLSAVATKRNLVDGTRVLEVIDLLLERWPVRNGV